MAASASAYPQFTSRDVTLVPYGQSRVGNCRERCDLRRMHFERRWFERRDTIDVRLDRPDRPVTPFGLEVLHEAARRSARVCSDITDSTRSIWNSGAARVQTQSSLVWVDHDWTARSSISMR